MSTIHRLEVCVTLVFLGLLTGCASILNGGKQTMTLDSQPSGSTVYVNGTEYGTTPLQYSYTPVDGEEVLFELRKQGYQSASVSMRPERNGAVLFVDAMLFHIPYLVDRNSPALYSLPASEYTVNMYREQAADLVRYMLPISGMESTLVRGTKVGTFQGTPIKIDKESAFRDLEQPELLSSAVATGLKGSWLEARVTRIGTTKGDEAVQKAKMHLRPQLKMVRATLKGERSRSYGPIEMEIEWRFYSALRTDSLLFSIPQSTTYHASGERVSELLGTAISHAARLLAEEPGLVEQMREHYGTGLALSKGGEVSIATPIPIPFASRKEMMSALVKAVVTIQTEKGHGSGFIISNDGYIITNEHVVGKEAVVRIKMQQGFTLDAQVLKTNKDFDLALLKVQASELPALAIGDDKGLMLGEEIFAIGTPLDATLGQSVSRGILSGHRELDERFYLQTDVSINPGNSGGPLIDETGKVVGVATMKISGKGLEGLGFGVPISVALQMLNIVFTP
jgi:serine protease Do